MPKRSRHKKLNETATASVTQLNHEGRGIAHIDGKTTFIFGALPGETVEFQYTRRHAKLDEGNTLSVTEPASDRATPLCQHFSICGGCSLQHISPEAQRKHKASVLLEHFQHQAHCMPGEILAPLHAEPWGYRRRARLSVKWVEKKNAVLVGFRERNSGFVADIKQCETLHPGVGHEIQAIRDCLMSLDNKSTIPQIEIAIGDNGIAFIVRHLTPLSDDDQAKLIALATAKKYQLYLQPQGPETIHCIYPIHPEKLFYEIPSHNMKIFFEPGQFTQINQAINLQMISRAIALLELKSTDRVLDLFCGIGNFSLPIARDCQHVVGVEGAEAAIEQAKSNATFNQLANTAFYVADLSKAVDTQPWINAPYNKILLDPPRAGAKELMPYIAKWRPERIVYVSCNPITLARDAHYLLELGYDLEKTGVMDMFPHTEHIEAIALFVLK